LEVAKERGFGRIGGIDCHDLSRFGEASVGCEIGHSLLQ
jgi:hypothetical protein